MDWNAEAWLSAVSDALDDVDGISKEKARELAKVAKEKMQDAVPRESGVTRDSIRYRTEKDAEGEYVEFGPLFHVARYIEYGTEHQPPRPFIRPAIEQAVAEVFG